MDADILKNLTDPAILFFFLGVTIGLIRSNLEIPAPIAKFLSLYLLMALGFKGGQALADAGLSGDGVKVIGAAIVLALVIPVIWFLVLRNRIDAFDAAAIAAVQQELPARHALVGRPVPCVPRVVRISRVPSAAEEVAHWKRGDLEEKAREPHEQVLFEACRHSRIRKQGSPRLK